MPLNNAVCKPTASCARLAAVIGSQRHNGHQRCKWPVLLLLLLLLLLPPPPYLQQACYAVAHDVIAEVTRHDCDVELRALAGSKREVKAHEAAAKVAHLMTTRGACNTKSAVPKSAPELQPETPCDYL